MLLLCSSCLVNLWHICITAIAVFRAAHVSNLRDLHQPHILATGQEREQVDGRRQEVVDTKERIIETTVPDPCGGVPTTEYSSGTTGRGVTSGTGYSSSGTTGTGTGAGITGSGTGAGYGTSSGTGTGGGYGSSGNTGSGSGTGARTIT